jgi:hypothetical protein
MIVVAIHFRLKISFLKPVDIQTSVVKILNRRKLILRQAQDDGIFALAPIYATLALAHVTS